MNSGGALLALLMLALSGCSREARLIASDQPQTAPHGRADPRSQRYLGNVYQVAQGGRYYSWYGCAACHGPVGTSATDLSNGSRLGVPDLYAAIAAGHGAAGYSTRIPSEQVWQIAAFIRDLADHTPAHNRRNAIDQIAEPQGSRWQGPLW